MNAMGKTPKQMGIQGDSFRVEGGGKCLVHYSPDKHPNTFYSISHLAGGMLYLELTSPALNSSERRMLSNCRCCLLFWFFARGS